MADSEDFPVIDNERMNANIGIIVEEIKETFPRINTVIRRFKHFLPKGDWDDEILDNLADRLITELRSYYSRDVDVTWSYDLDGPCYSDNTGVRNHKSGVRYFIEVNSLYVPKHFSGETQKRELVWIEEYLRGIDNGICNILDGFSDVADAIGQLTGTIEYTAKKGRKRSKRD
jgi:hypothetical protein